MATASSSFQDPNIEAALLGIQQDLESAEPDALRRALGKLSQIGRSHLLSHPEEAARALIQAARIAVLVAPEQADELLDLAEPTAIAQGLLADLWRARAEVASGRGVGADAAWQRAASAGEAPQRSSALLHLADLRRTANDPAGAAAALAEALALPSLREPERAAPLIIDRAACLAASGDDAAALQELARAEALSARLGHPPALHARLLGQQSAMALKDGQLPAALSLLLTARQRAVAASDVQVYLGVVVLLTGVYLALEQEVDAYDTMVRARVSLKDLLGPPGEALVQPAIAAFAERLGDRFDVVRDQWIAARRAQASLTPTL